VPVHCQLQMSCACTQSARRRRLHAQYFRAQDLWDKIRKDVLRSHLIICHVEALCGQPALKRRRGQCAAARSYTQMHLFALISHPQPLRPVVHNTESFKFQAIDTSTKLCYTTASLRHQRPCNPYRARGRPSPAVSLLHMALLTELNAASGHHGNSKRPA
jgi:hypothetical protein